MHKTQSFTFLLALTGVFALACGTTGDENGNDGGADASTDAQTGDVTSSSGDTAPAAPFKYIVIYDNIMPDCTTTGPGTDLDAVELKRGGSVIGVGKTGSSSYQVGGATLKSTPCAMMGCGAAKNALCKYADAALKGNVEGVANGEVKEVGDDVGYFSLNGGSVALEIGDATGAGTGQELKAGDTIRVYEVDLYYQSRSASPTPPKAYAMCTCTPDRYDVFVAPSLDPTVFAATAKQLKASAYQTENAVCGAVGATSSGCGSTEFVVPTM